MNIRGTFKEPSHRGRETEWKGSIRHSNGTIEGELTDCYGKSIIHGFMDKEVFMFTKQYEGRSDDLETIIFALKKGPDEKWTGNWAYRIKLGSFTWLQENKITDWSEARITALQITEIPSHAFGIYGGEAVCTLTE